MTVTEVQHKRGSLTSRYRSDIQGLRGVAVLAVVLFHVEHWLSGGYLGVDAFLVISGFVITGTFVREVDRSGSIDLLSFYRRRMQRLLPAFAVTVCGVLLMVRLVASGDTGPTAKTAIYASTFRANYITGVGGQYPLGHTWSLSLEEQFYFVFPAVFVLLTLWASRWRTLLLGTVLVASLAQYMGAVGWFAERAALQRHLLERGWQFLAGALLALTVPAIQRCVTVRAAWLMTVAGGGLVVWAFRDGAYWRDLGVHPLIVTVGISSLVAAGTAAPSTTRWLAARWLTWIGDRSYGWYLLHWPAIYVAVTFGLGRGGQLLSALAALWLADLVSRFVEEPIRRADLSVRTSLLLVVGSIAAPVALAGVLG